MKFIIKRSSYEAVGLDGVISGETHKILRCGKDYFECFPINRLTKECINIVFAVDSDGPCYKGECIKADRVDLFEVNTLEEMLALVEKVGSVIIFPPDNVEGYYTLEIYDDYRE